MHGEFYTFECAKRIINCSGKVLQDEGFLDEVWVKVYENCTTDLTQLYIASQNTNDLQKRQRMLLKLAEEAVRQQKVREVMFGKCMLAPHDVVLLCDGLQQQIKKKPNLPQMHVY